MTRRILSFAVKFISTKNHPAMTLPVSIHERPVRNLWLRSDPVTAQAEGGWPAAHPSGCYLLILGPAGGFVEHQIGGFFQSGGALAPVAATGTQADGINTRVSKCSQAFSHHGLCTNEVG